MKKSDLKANLFLAKSHIELAKSFNHKIDQKLCQISQFNTVKICYKLSEKPIGLFFDSKKIVKSL
ncbi:hypothetical protein L289_2130 [Acinetobacter gerneri DSM 14967 = CIP 107464 = MTCC 9824]|nr:hypothetical protein L289_2130 [Acinetobacter gerneri DSM 14967 = CIP 107464 = MTCC 9824]